MNPDEGPIDFQTTAWSQVLRLRDGGARATETHRAALESLIRAYWRPVYAYIRRRGHDAHAAEDLTQAFFLRVMERDAFRHLEPDRGSFRGYLCAAVQHFLVSEHRHRTAQRRHPAGRRVLELDGLEEALGALVGDQDATPEAIYDRRWAEEVIRRSVERMEKDYERRGQRVAFEVFERFVLDRDGSPDGPASQADLAKAHGLTVTQVNNYIHRGKTRFAEAIRRTVADYVSDPEALEREVAALRSYLAR